MMVHVLHIVAGLPPEGGGLSEVVPRLVIAERAEGIDAFLATRGKPPFSPAAEEAEGKGVRLVRYAPSWPHFLFFSWQMLFRLPGLIRSADVVHVHGNWTFPVWWGCFWALRRHKKLVMSPHGSFDPVRLRYSAWKKRLVGWMDRFFIRHATFVHATCEAERDWCRAFARRDDLPVVVIPVGIELPPEPEPQPSGKKAYRTVLYLGRLHPLKGLDLLLEAWRQAFGTEQRDWRLVICGPDEQGVRASLEKQASRLSISEQVDFLDGVYGSDKWRLLRSADCFVLPTRSENFGVSVAEALACGVPVICTQGAPWRSLETEGCGWWCPVSADGIASALATAIAGSAATRQTMGGKGRHYIDTHLTWPILARDMAERY